MVSGTRRIVRRVGAECEGARNDLVLYCTVWWTVALGGNGVVVWVTRDPRYTRFDLILAVIAHSRLLAEGFEQVIVAPPCRPFNC